jgi:general nucleoside transport system permease protein
VTSSSASSSTTRLPVLLPPGPGAGSTASWGGRFAAPIAFAVFGLVDILVFGLHAHGSASFGFTPEFAKVTVPNLVLPGPGTAYFCGAVSLVLAAVRCLSVLGRLSLGRAALRVVVGLVLFLFVVALIAWSDAGQSISFNVVNLMSGSLDDSIPIMLGALTGVICSTSGVINIAIEGQLLLGAFCAAIATSVTGSLWLGLLCGALAGSLVAALLAVFSIAYLVDQVVLGVVINTLVLGLTGYLYNAIMVPYGNTLNNPVTFNPWKVPLLGDIPIIGPVFFDSNVFLYLTYALFALVQVGLFRTRWGLRTRAVGEHPVAADTVGIRVIVLRYQNVIIAGLIAGVGGAYFTIGSVGSFGIDMTSGEGYIALAAMIFGRYTPFGAIGAALLFGFTTQLQSILSSLNVPIESNLLLLTPYVVTIIVVAGLIGRVRGPRAEGVPFVKSLSCGKDACRGKGAGQHDRSGHGLADPHDVLGAAVAQVLPGRGGRPVGLLFDLSPQRVARRGQRAVAVEQAAVGQADDGGVPLLLAPAAAGPGERGDEPLARGGVRDQRLEAAKTGGDKRAAVAVAAVLAQQRYRVPHHQVRGVGPGQLGVPGVQGAALGGAGACRSAGQLGQREHVAGGDDLLAEQAGERGVDGGEARLDHGGRAGQLPGRRDGPGHQARAEVIEGRGDHAAADRPHRGRAAGEIAHPTRSQADSGEVLLGLGDEVDQRVQ